MLKRLNKHLNKILPDSFFLILGFSLIFCFIAYLNYKYILLLDENGYLSQQIYFKDDIYSSNISYLRNSLNQEKIENSILLTKLDEEKNRNDDYGKQINSLSSVVGDLYKLSQTDRELLQKYSNVYFLNENYIPSSLVDIPQIYLLRKEKTEQIHTNILPYLENLLKSAESENIDLKVFSAYRSFGTQASIKNGYKVTYGTTAANKFSADQGYSEHQLASTIDFTSEKTGDNLNGFDKTEAFKWLTENAHKYGFTLSYPKANKFFQYEPWHFRFVGVELATKLFNEKKNFYDLDQRVINEYLIKIFN